MLLKQIFFEIYLYLHMLLEVLVHSYMCCTPLFGKRSSCRQSHVQLKTSIRRTLGAKIQAEHCHYNPLCAIQPQNACTSSLPQLSCHVLLRRTALNAQHKQVQGCSCFLICQELSTNVMSAKDALHFIRRQPEHESSDKGQTRHQIIIIFTVHKSVQQLTYVQAPVSKELSRFCTKQMHQCKQETSALKRVRAFENNNNLFHTL